MYWRWQRRLPAWVQIAPVELPGRGTRINEPAEEAFESLVARLCDELAPRLLQGRFALFGHSMGALLVYGIANALRARLMPMPSALLVSACAAPSQRTHEHFADKQDEAGLIADLRKQGGTPEEVFENPELLHMTLTVLGADYRVCESFRYRPVSPLPLPLHVFAGRSDEIHEARMQAWQSESAGEFSINWFDGGHFFLRQHEEAFLSLLVRHLAGAPAGATSAAVAPA